MKISPKFSESIIKERVRVLAMTLDRNISVLSGDDETIPIFTPILDGAMIFASDLLRQMEENVDMLPIKVRSRLGRESSDDLKIDWLDFNRWGGKGRDIILVDTILDSGRTLSAIKQKLAGHEAKSITFVSLLKRNGTLEGSAQRGYDLSGIHMISGPLMLSDSDFVVGYGLDYYRKYRGLSDIWDLAAVVPFGEDDMVCY